MKYETEQRRSLLFAPTPPITEQERPICNHSALCKDCPHAGHGFICWHRDGTCLRTDMNKINGLEEENVSSDSE